VIQADRLGNAVQDIMLVPLEGTTMSNLRCALCGPGVIILSAVLLVSAANAASVKESLAGLEVQRGIVAVVGLPEGNASALVDALNGNEITLW
jgi:hypothetical protein